MLKSRNHTGPGSDLVAMLIGITELKINFKDLTHKTLSVIKLSEPQNRQVLKGTLDQFAKKYSIAGIVANG